MQIFDGKLPFLGESMPRETTILCGIAACRRKYGVAEGVGV